MTSHIIYISFIILSKFRMSYSQIPYDVHGPWCNGAMVPPASWWWQYQLPTQHRTSGYNKHLQINLKRKKMVMTNIATLPREVLLKIFSLLGYRDFISVRRTCQLWHRLSQDHGLIQRIARRDFSEESWSNGGSFPSSEQIGLATFLGVCHGDD